MAWTIEFDPRTEKQLRKLGRREAGRIIDYLEHRVAVLDNPRQLGKPLKGEKTEFWRYRVGDYRVICHLEDQRLRILVVRVGHRREVYRR